LLLLTFIDEELIMNEDKGHKKNTDKKGARLAKNRATRDDTRLLAEIQQLYTWIIHLGIWDMKSHLAGLKATFGALRILTERRSW
jgi:hypothetical protein